MYHPWSIRGACRGTVATSGQKSWLERTPHRVQRVPAPVHVREAGMRLFREFTVRELQPWPIRVGLKEAPPRARASRGPAPHTARDPRRLCSHWWKGSVRLLKKDCERTAPWPATRRARRAPMLQRGASRAAKGEGNAQPPLSPCAMLCSR